MTSYYSISLQLRNIDWLEKAKGLLVPIPPSTAHQLLIGTDIGSLGGVLLKEKSSRQRAWWIKDVNLALQEGFHFNLRLEDMELDISDFNRPLNRHTRAHKSVKKLLESELKNSTSPMARIRNMVNLLEGKFQYHHGYSGDELPSLNCDIVTGNCLDINTVFIQMLALEKIPAAYYIGYFFEDNKPLLVDDWHCWVSTMDDHQQQYDWDIAHHLKRRITPIEDGLNPVPGIRFAMSCGRGLQFVTPDNDPVEVGHFGLPRAVFGVGRTKECPVIVEAKRFVS